MKHPFGMNSKQLKPVSDSLQELDNSQVEHIAGGASTSTFTSWFQTTCRKWFGKPGNEITTLALGEEGGDMATTLAIGEEGGDSFSTSSFTQK